MKTTKALKKLFEDSIKISTNLYYTCSGHGASRDSYMSGIYSLYYHMFHTMPYEFEICQFLEPINSFDKFTKNDYKFAKKYLYGYNKYRLVNFIETLYNIKNKNEENCYITSFSGVTMIILDQYIVYWNQESSFSILCPNYKSIEDNTNIDCEKIHFLNIAFCGDVWNDDFNINDYLIYDKIKKEKVLPTYHYLIHTPQGFDVTDFTLKDTFNINLDENYNEDLPHQKITDFLNTPGESGIIMLNGIPGSGKSYYIRNLISNMSNKDFIVLNESCLAYINDPSFLKILMKYEDSVVILEDCERLLIDRNDGNSLIGTLLNLSDGLISDTFNLKFICTFNAQITKIDPALLRKGRLKARYEFKELKADRVKKVAERLGKKLDEYKDMPLTDIYNYEETVDFSSKEKKGIGFMN